MLHLIIDGYNLMRCSRHLIQDRPSDLESQRAQLIKKLAQYRKLKPCRITVVFDGTHSGNFTQNFEKEAGIHMVYSQHGETADEIIIEAIRSHQSQLVVVSSDREILHAAQKAGCPFLESGEFERKLYQAQYYDLKGIEDEEKKRPQVHKRWVTKKKGPAKRLPKAKRKAEERLKKL